MRNFFIIITLSTSFLWGQKDSAQWYKDYIKKADYLYEVKDYKNSLLTYDSAFIFENKIREAEIWVDRFNAAEVSVLNNDKDKAFKYLNKIVSENTRGRDGLLTRRQLIMQASKFQFNPLVNDSRWQELENKISLLLKEYDKKIIFSIKNKLDSIAEIDQRFRKKLIESEKKYGRRSKKTQVLIKEINVSDSLNTIEVVGILDKYGWLGEETVGSSGHEALFLVIQHSNLKIQEKYLPMLQDAVKNGRSHSMFLALLEDRVAVGQGKKQKYGTQLETNSDGTFSVSPIEDELNVNKRRAEMGLGPIEEYLKNYGINYKPAKVKKKSSP